MRIVPVCTREFEKRLKRHAGSEIELRKTHLHAGERSQSIEQSEHTDERNVAFEERIGCLRRRMRDKRYFAWRDIALCQQLLYAGDDPRGDAFRGSMGGRNFYARYNRSRCCIDSNDVGECASDIYSQAKRTRHRPEVLNLRTFVRPDVPDQFEDEVMLRLQLIGIAVRGIQLPAQDAAVVREGKICCIERLWIVKERRLGSHDLAPTRCNGLSGADLIRETDAFEPLLIQTAVVERLPGAVGLQRKRAKARYSNRRLQIGTS